MSMSINLERENVELGSLGTKREAGAFSWHMFHQPREAEPKQTLEIEHNESFLPASITVIKGHRNCPGRTGSN